MQLGQAEVADLGHPVNGQEHVAGLQIAVHDPGLVGSVHGTGERLDQFGRLMGRRGSLAIS